MKHTKRIMALLLAALMLLALCACGSSGTTSTPAASSGSSGSGSSTPAASSGSSSSGSSTPAASSGTAEPAPQADDSAKYGGDLTIAWTNLPQQLYAAESLDQVNIFVWPAVEAIARRTIGTNDFEPLLAESWESNEAEKSFTIHLRKGIKFHDGSDLTAEVVAWNYDQMKELGQAGFVDNFTSSEIVDEYTLKLLFDHYNYDWISLFGVIPIYSMKAGEQGKEYLEANPVGTGPFVFKELVNDDHISYVKNENYWQEGLPYLDSFTIQSIKDDMAAMSALINNEVQYFATNNEIVRTSILGMGYTDKMVADPSAYTVYCLYPNSKVEDDPFYDVNVRKAVMLYGIDWETVALMGGGQFASAQFQMDIEGSVCHVDELEKISVYDVDKAKQMLADAGYPNGFKTQIFAPNIFMNAATAIQDQLKKINIEAEVVPVTVQDTQRKDGVTPGLSLTQSATFYDITGTRLRAWYSEGSKNFGNNLKYPDSYMDALSKALAATTLAERQKYGQEAVRILQEEYCLIRSIYKFSKGVFINDKVHDTGIFSVVITPELTWIEK